MQAVLEFRKGADHCRDYSRPGILAVPARRSSSLPVFANARTL
jgi:hypothetical protein